MSYITTQLLYISALLYILLIGFVQFISTTQHYDIISQRLNCITTPQDLCTNVNCTTRPINRTLTYLNFKCSLLEPVDNVRARVTLYYKFVEYRIFLIDFEIDICDLLSNKMAHPIAKIIKPFVLDNSNIRSCPLKGDLTFSHLDINNEYIPPGLPAGQYRLDSFIKSNDRMIAITKVYFVVKPKGLAKLEMG